MRIKELSIKNFKNIGIKEACKIVFPGGDQTLDFISIIGENNIGKSSVLEALRLFFPGYVSVPSQEMFPFREQPDMNNENQWMEIIVTFADLTDGDISHPFISPYVYDNELRVRRRWNKANMKDADAPFEVFIPVRKITQLEQAKTWNNSTFKNTTSELQQCYSDFCALKEIKEGGTITKEFQNDFVEYVYNQKPSLVAVSGAKWVPNPNGFSSKTRSIMPRVIYVPAVKLINDEADANKSKSAANAIVSALFEDHLNSAKEIQGFNSALQSIRQLFTVDSRHEEIKDLQTKISKKVQRVMQLDVELDFEPPEVMEKLHLNTSIYLKNGELKTEPEHQGNGAQRILILSLLEMMAEYASEEAKKDKGEVEEVEWKRGFLFLIEEPEIYLHPHLQKKMRDALVTIAKNSFAQIVCTSHSEHFINLADRHQGIVLFKKDMNGFTESLQVTQNIYDGETAQEKRDRMRMLLNFTSSTLEAFFAERVVLVEGDCEIASIDAIARKLVELERVNEDKVLGALKKITVVSCNGKLTQLAYHEVLSHFGVNAYLVHDADGDALDHGNNAIILAAIGSEEFRLVHEPNFEGYIFEEKWDRDKPWKSVTRIQNRFEDHEAELLRFFKFVIGNEKFASLGLEDNKKSTIS